MIHLKGLMHHPSKTTTITGSKSQASLKLTTKSTKMISMVKTLQKTKTINLNNQQLHSQL
jgi:hypothetical protein